MKKTFKYSLLAVFMILATIACRDEEAVRFPDFVSGASARLVLYPERSFINFDDINNAAIAFDLYTVNNNIDEVVYTATFTEASDPEADYPSVDVITVKGSDFVNGKVTEIEITAEELAQALGLPGGAAYFEGGDNILFEAAVKLTDGRVFDASNSAPSITGGGNASFTTQFTAYVGCPSNVEAIEGTYISTMQYNNFGIGIDAEVEVEIEFVGPEPFRYSVTDHTAELYTCCGGTQYAADFYDICGTAILQPATSFGGVINYIPDPADTDFGSPVFDFSTEATTFYLNWNETFNGIFASVKFVKKTEE